MINDTNRLWFILSENERKIISKPLLRQCKSGNQPIQAIKYYLFFVLVVIRTTPKWMWQTDRTKSTWKLVALTFVKCFSCFFSAAVKWSERMHFLHKQLFFLTLFVFVCLFRSVSVVYGQHYAFLLVHPNGN